MQDNNLWLVEGLNNGQARRQIKHREHNILHRLRSIEEDVRLTVVPCSERYPMPVFANLRAGKWYVPFQQNEQLLDTKVDVHTMSQQQHTCYFKSTDGHANHCKFSLSRLNLSLLDGITSSSVQGAIVVDVTRKGKRFPDSFSRTIPIWACVMNRAICALHDYDINDWDHTIHFPTWVTPSEQAMVEECLETWTTQVLQSGAQDEIRRLTKELRKPLRVLWVHRKTQLWPSEVLKEVPFTPILCVSASVPEADRIKNGERQGWHYLQGAGDDEEFWAHEYKLTPELFWRHKNALLQCPDEETLLSSLEQIVTEKMKSEQQPTTTTSIINWHIASINNRQLYVQEKQQLLQSVRFTLDVGCCDSCSAGELVSAFRNKKKVTTRLQTDAMAFHEQYDAIVLCVNMPRKDILTVDRDCELQSCEIKLNRAVLLSDTCIVLPVGNVKKDKMHVLTCIKDLVAFLERITTTNIPKRVLYITHDPSMGLLFATVIMLYHEQLAASQNSPLSKMKITQVFNETHITLSKQSVFASADLPRRDFKIQVNKVFL